MAVKWDGFSEEDITKMKSVSNGEDAMERPKTKKTELSSNGQRKSNTMISKSSTGQNNTLYANDINSTPSTDLQAPQVKVSNQLVESHMTGSDSSLYYAEDPQESFNDQSQSIECCDSTTADLKPHVQLSDLQTKSLIAKLVIPSVSQPPPSSINLSDFRKKHRLMEEQNRARKVFLAKALEDRKKQTHAEQVRLGMIQEELQKLDQRLSCDVSIIRNQIEAASLEFMEAQKRYDRAEKEFLDAKLLLYTKLERKELLTHHLCTIIEQNEMRKAQKLSELMEKLQMPEDASQNHEDGVTKLQQNPEHALSSVKQECTSIQLKQKSSSEIILTPTSVVPHTDASRTDSLKSPLQASKEHLPA